jgi:hypothetical protein
LGERASCRYATNSDTGIGSPLIVRAPDDSATVPVKASAGRRSQRASDLPLASQSAAVALVLISLIACSN